jgi:hypothetical protein
MLADSPPRHRPQIYTGPVLDPFLSRFVLHVPARLDVAAMRAAAARLVGTHDFTSFTKPDPSRAGRLQPVKTLQRLDVCSAPAGADPAPAPPLLPSTRPLLASLPVKAGGDWAHTWIGHSQPVVQSLPSWRRCR